MLFYLFVVQYVTWTLFCLSVMVSTVPADYEPCEPHGFSSGVCVCCSIEPRFVCSFLALWFLCVRILFVDSVHTRGPKQFNTTHITYTV